MLRHAALARLALLFPSRSLPCSRMFSTLALTLFASMLGTGLALGQATTSVRGTVTDPDGNAVVGE